MTARPGCGAETGALSCPCRAAWFTWVLCHPQLPPCQTVPLLCWCGTSWLQYHHPEVPSSYSDPPRIIPILQGPALSLLCTCCAVMVPNRHGRLPQTFPAVLLWSMLPPGFEPCFRKLGAIYKFSQGSFGGFLQLHLQKLRSTAPFLSSFLSRWLQYCSLQTPTSPPHSEETHRDPGFPPCGQGRVKSHAWHGVIAQYSKGTWKTA